MCNGFFMAGSSLNQLQSAGVVIGRTIALKLDIQTRLLITVKLRIPNGVHCI